MRTSQNLARFTLILTLVSTALVGCRATCSPGKALQNGVCVSPNSGNAQTESDAGEPAANNGTTTGEPKQTTGTNQAGSSAPTTSISGPQQASNSGAMQTGTQTNPASSAPAGSAGSGGTSSAPNTSNAGANQQSGPPDAGTASSNTSNAPGSNCVPMPEECDGQDNDCDMRIDEEIEPMKCGVDKGICKSGTLECRNGQWDTECQGSTEPQTETCDAQNLDEDCDGIPNNGCKCTDGETMECGVGPYTCKKGTITCTDGQPSACEGEVKGSAEKCDGEDNDCDGTVDNGGDRLCSGSTRFCAGANGCVACKGDSDCQKSTTQCADAYCDVSRHSCATRMAADNSACTVSGSQRGVCSTGKCVECSTSTDCSSGEVCDRNACVKSCGNMKLDQGEACDLGAPSEGNDGVAFRVHYKQFTCDTSCRRLYYYETCPPAGCGAATCVARSGMDSLCVSSCSGQGAQCSVPGGGSGFCFSGGCYPYCTTNTDCPGDTTCRGDASGGKMICL